MKMSPNETNIITPPLKWEKPSENYVWIFVEGSTEKNRYTMDWIKTAISLGVDGIFAPVDMLADGTLIVFESESLPRLGIERPIYHLTLEELNGVLQVHGSSILLFKDLIDIAVKNNLFINILVKDSALLGPILYVIHEEHLEQKMLLTIRDLNFYQSLVTIPVFVPVAYQYFLFKRKIKSIFEQYPLAVVQPFHWWCSQKLIKHAHENYSQVFAWGIKKQKTVKKLISRGIDGIIFNDLESLAKTL